MLLVLILVLVLLLFLIFVPVQVQVTGPFSNLDMVFVLAIFPGCGICPGPRSVGGGLKFQQRSRSLSWSCSVPGPVQFWFRSWSRSWFLSLLNVSTSFSSLCADKASHQSDPVWLKTAEWTSRRSRLFQLLTRAVWRLQEAGRDKSGCAPLRSTVPTTTSERKQ